MTASPSGPVADEQRGGIAALHQRPQALRDHGRAGRDLLVLGVEVVQQPADVVGVRDLRTAYVDAAQRRAMVSEACSVLELLPAWSVALMVTR